MAVTSEQVRAALTRDEPDYDEAAKLGPEALPHLQRFVEGSDANLASKAAYLAGRIGDPDAVPILETAAGSADAAVRAAAASGARHLPDEQADSLVQTLVDDDDPGVRKLALRATPATPSPELAEKLEVLREHETEPSLRDLAGEAADRASGKGT
jgi:HEAT repeat protein